MIALINKKNLINSLKFHPNKKEPSVGDGDIYLNVVWRIHSISSDLEYHVLFFQPIKSNDTIPTVTLSVAVFNCSPPELIHRIQKHIFFMEN